MRRIVLYGIGWVAAAAVAVLLAWQGVGLVGRNVTDAHPRALTADEAREALGDGSKADGTVPDTGPATTSSTAGGSSGGSNTTVTTRAQPRSTATTAGTAPGPSSPATPTSPTPTTTRPQSPAATPTTTAGIVRTYNLVGGSTALRFEPGKVTVLWANPNPGFRVEVDDRDGGGIRVRFDGVSGRSEVEAWWDGGPQDRVDDQGGGGGGSGPG